MKSINEVATHHIETRSFIDKNKKMGAISEGRVRAQHGQNTVDLAKELLIRVIEDRGLSYIIKSKGNKIIFKDNPDIEIKNPDITVENKLTGDLVCIIETKEYMDLSMFKRYLLEATTVHKRYPGVSFLYFENENSLAANTRDSWIKETGLSGYVFGHTYQQRQRKNSITTKSDLELNKDAIDFFWKHIK
jgi:hypothetical protein